MKINCFDIGYISGALIAYALQYARQELDWPTWALLVGGTACLLVGNVITKRLPG